MTEHRRRIGSGGAAASTVALLFLFLVAACDTPPVVEPDYRVRHAPTVEKKTFAMAMTMSPDGTPPSTYDAKRLRGFVGIYLRRAEGPFRILTPPALDEATSRARAEAVGVHLMAEGIRPGDIVLEAGQAPVDDRYAVVLSFRGAEIKVSDCGDWSGRSAFNPTNLPHTDYGCSYQRNIGLMLSDPRDLVRGRPLGRSDSQARSRVIQLYCAGSATGSEAPSGEAGTASEGGSDE